MVKNQGWASSLRKHERSIEREMRVVYLVLRDSRVPWYCKAVATVAAGYALSPITLIPDWVPVIGFLDNLFVLGLGIWIVHELTPSGVMLECRMRAARQTSEAIRANRPLVRAAVAGGVGLKVALALLFSGALLVWLRLL